MTREQTIQWAADMELEGQMGFLRGGSAAKVVTAPPSNPGAKVATAPPPPVPSAKPVITQPSDGKERHASTAEFKLYEEETGRRRTLRRVEDYLDGKVDVLRARRYDQRCTDEGPCTIVEGSSSRVAADAVMSLAKALGPNSVLEVDVLNPGKGGIFRLDLKRRNGDWGLQVYAWRSITEDLKAGRVQKK
jgi:hypothetical protein